LRHPLFVDEYDLTVDDKNRLLVPSQVRKAIVPDRDGEALFVVIGRNQVPWLYTERYYEYLVSTITNDLSPNDDQLAFDQLKFALASRLEFDKQNRVLIPDKTLKRAGIRKDVTLLGVRDHLELWNRTDWAAHRDELEKRSSEIEVRAKQARQGPSQV
jgi:MraZ protein